MEASERYHRHFSGIFLAAAEQQPVQRRVDRIPGSDQMVRPGARAALPGAGSFHCRCYFSICLPGGRHEIPGGGCQKSNVLRRGLGVGFHPGGLLLHRTAPVCRHLEARGRARPGDRFPILRAGHQHPGHRANGPHTRPAYSAPNSAWREPWGPSCSASSSA